MLIRNRLYTAEEFFEIARLPENDNRRLELEDGVIIEMAASRPINTVIATRMATFLNNHIMKNNAGYVSGADGGYKLANDRVRQPDVAFIAKKRYPELPDEFEGGPDIAVEVVSPNDRVRQPDVAFISKKRYPELPDEFEGGPDIAVEVVSPNEDVPKKASEYLESGTTLVWAIYPDEKKVHVLRASEPRWRELSVEDTLSGETALPDFKLPVKDIFPPVE